MILCQVAITCCNNIRDSDNTCIIKPQHNRRHRLCLRRKTSNLYIVLDRACSTLFCSHFSAIDFPTCLAVHLRTKLLILLSKQTQAVVLGPPLLRLLKCSFAVYHPLRIFSAKSFLRGTDSVKSAARLELIKQERIVKKGTKRKHTR